MTEELTEYYDESDDFRYSCHAEIQDGITTFPFRIVSVFPFYLASHGDPELYGIHYVPAEGLYEERAIYAHSGNTIPTDDCGIISNTITEVCECALRETESRHMALIEYDKSYNEQHSEFIHQNQSKEYSDVTNP
jgi:hypothetical protein